MRELLLRAPRLQSISYATRGVVTIPRQRVLVPHINTKFDQTIDRINNHPANNHPFSEYLVDQSEKGFTTAQLEYFRRLYYARTNSTIKVVGLALLRAIKEENNQAMVEIGGNLADEAGAYGSPDKTHPQLMKNSFNTLCQHVYGLPPISLANVSNLENMPQAVKNYHRMQKSIYSDRSSWATIAGCMFAHEKLAHPMLVTIFQCMFKPLEGYFEKNPEQWKMICAYFDAHIKADESGISVEEQHGKAALEVIKKIALENPRALEQIEKGAMAFFNATVDLWSKAMEEMIKNEQYGIRVPPKSIKDKKQNDKAQPSNSAELPQAKQVSSKSHVLPLLS